MGNLWQAQDQKEFFDEHLASYVHNSEARTLKTVFWPPVLAEWFKRWPLSEPPSDLVGKEGSTKAEKMWRTKRVDVSATQ